MYVSKIVVGFVAGVVSIVALGAVCVILAVNASDANAAHRKSRATMISTHRREIETLKNNDRAALAKAVDAARKAQRERDHAANVKQLKKARNAAEKQAEQARQDGLSSGYASGQTDGQQQGREEGYEDGHEDGLSDGSDELTCSDDMDVPLPSCDY